MDEPIERNRKLFYQVAEYIETYPERYDQEDWGQGIIKGEIFNGKQLSMCGSHMCIAGTAVMLEGWQPDKRALKSEDWCYVTNGVVGSAASSDVATAVLGIDGSERKLFQENWRPKDGMTVPEALRALGDGSSVESVSQWVEESDDEDSRSL